MIPIDTSSWTLQQWARARRADILAREHENSLHVGFHKPLGGRGFPATIPGIWSMWKATWEAKARAGVYPVRLVNGGVTSGQLWIYAYDVLGMRDIITTHLFHLRDVGWPTEPDALVARIRDEMVPPRSYLYGFVADCYGDALNPGRTGVMPGRARVDLLSAYLDEHGEPDPSFIYFVAAHHTIPESYDAFLPARGAP